MKQPLAYVHPGAQIGENVVIDPLHLLTTM